MGFFGVIVVIFDGVKSGEMLDFVGFARSVSRSDFGYFLDIFCEIGFLKLRCGWNRYPGFRCRTLVLKCKHTP